VNIELLYFAQIREAFGTDRESLDVGDGSTVDRVVEILRRREEWARVARIPLTYAVNERVVGGDHVLRPGDRLVLLTPISGG
jgi:molybdopterin converting factor small subunit